MESLESISLNWWAVIVTGLVFAASVALWRTKLVRLLRAVRLENRGMRLFYAESPHPRRAEELLLRSLRLAEAADGSEGAEVGPIVANLAQIYQFQEKFDEAERLYRRAIAIREHAVGPTDAFLPLVLGNLAHLLESRGRESEAAALARGRKPFKRKGALTRRPSSPGIQGHGRALGLSASRQAGGSAWTQPSPPKKMVRPKSISWRR